MIKKKKGGSFHNQTRFKNTRSRPGPVKWPEQVGPCNQDQVCHHCTAVRRHTGKRDIQKTSVEYTCVAWSNCWHMAHVHIAIFMVAPSVSSPNSGMSTRAGESFADDPQGSARSNNRAELRLTRRGKAEALMRFIVRSRSHLRGLWGTMCEKIQISELRIQVKKKVTEPQT